MPALKKHEGPKEIAEVIERLSRSKRVDFRWLSGNEAESFRRALNHLHNSEKMSLLEISRRVGRSFTFVWGLCRRLGIEIRSVEDANRLSAPKRSKHPKFPFDGTILDAAYLKGFAEGDLDVRRASGLAIMVSSTTTHPAFVQLVADTFAHNGPLYRYPIYEQSLGYRWKVAARLDMSFAFLLPGTRKKYPFFADGAGEFFSWLAGILDSDGNISVVDSGGYARAQIAFYNEDRHLLGHIKRGLLDAGYHPVGPYVLAEAGKVTYGYYLAYRCDMLSLLLQRREEVLSLLEKLPLRHAEKQQRKTLALSLTPGIKWGSVEKRVRALQNRVRSEVVEFAALAESIYMKREGGEVT